MRIKDIDIAKGIGIFLVVFGHIASYRSLFASQWYLTLRDYIYHFHMPFFMYLSGLVFFLVSLDKINSITDYTNFIKKRAFRLLLPFFIFGVVITAGKMVASNFLHVEKLPNNFFMAIANTIVLWDVNTSPVFSIWYIYVLFVFCVIVPPILRLLRSNLFLLYCLSLILFFLPLPWYFYLKMVGTYLVFFLAGGIAAIWYEKYTATLDRYWVLWLAILGLSFGLLLFNDEFNINLFVIGTTSIPALHAFSRRSFVLNSKFLALLGKYTFSIYLLNTICIGLGKGVLYVFIDINDSNFFLVLPVLVACGIAIPIFVRRFVFSRIKYVDEMTS